MCGIAALIDIGSNRLDSSLIRSMAMTVRHRGPDDEGYWGIDPSGHHRTWGGGDTPDAVFASDCVYRPLRAGGEQTDRPMRVLLGHRRLSIVDLSPSGHQPMSTADARCWITYNGEVYNHIELRKELESLGARFRSRSDTEVILEAYRFWGDQCLHRFNGMFAFVLVDLAQRRIFAARDRFGVKPLYVWKSPAGFLAIGSEIKQFTVLPGWSAVLHGQRAYEFLNWGLTDHTADTLFEGVHQLSGGQFLELSLDRPNAGPSIQRWYRLQPRIFEGDEPFAARRCRELLEDAVRLRLRADVPVGSCLSGGLDSSSIVCLASSILREAGVDAPHTFSARAHDSDVDEGRHIAEVVGRTNARGHDVYPDSAELLASLENLAWHQDEPFASTSIFAQWAVFAMAGRHNVRVMLDGQGADETLAGYHGFFGARMAGLARQWEFRELLAEIRAIRAIHGYSLMRSVAYLADYALPAAITFHLRRLALKDSVAQDDWLNLAVLGHDRGDPRAVDRASVRKLSLSQIESTNLPMLLHWEDRNSMAHSVESRVPFLDYRLVEFVTGLPESMLVSRGITKRVLRRAMQGILPDSVRERTDKIGFATPEQTWMCREAPGAFIEMATRAVEQSRGVLLPGATHRARDVIEGRRPFSFLVWRLISFGAWMNRFAVQPRS